MKLFQISKDGGEDSRVWGYFLIEWKSAFSIVLLHFKDGSREAYHTHAFNALSWVLWGQLEEEVMTLNKLTLWETVTYKPSLKPIYTARNRLHKVSSKKNSWVLSFRGPWVDRWKEVVNNKKITLTHGRVIVDATD